MLNLAVTNTANNGREIFVWHRSGKTLSLFKDNSYFPYFYQESKTGLFHTIDNKRVTKIFCSRPSDVSKKRDENSYEADVLYYRRYVIDKIGSFLSCELKYSFIDIEVQCPELPSHLNPIYPIVSISCSNSYTNEIKTFFIGESSLDISQKGIEICEKQILNSFVKWIKEQQFDFLAGWNFINFDYQYLRARYYKLFEEELADMLSPINSNRIVGKKDEEDPLKIPTGLGIVDYLAWFRKVYKGRHSYALDYIAQEELKESAYEKVDFNILSDKVKEKNINDVRRMIDIEKKLKIINYYDELRRMSKSDWQDLDWNSKMLDMMLLTEARQKGIVLPSKKYGIETDETFEGAYRRCDTGLYKNLWKLDLSSAYPMAIINFCLDVQNIKENEGIDINGTKFYQNSQALLPSLARKLIDKKDYLKKQLKALDPETIEAKDMQVKYDAVKGVVNSLFGVCGLKVFRLFDMRVAGAITFLVRDLLHYIETELEKRSVKVIYIDTDSVFVDSNDNPKDLLNQLITQWAKEKYNKENIGIEFDLEGKINKILIVALCHYIAEVETKSGIKKEIKGVEVKRSDSSKYMKYFQETLIDKIMNEESREAIEAFIASEKEAIKTKSLIEIGFPCKVSGKTDYKSIPIFMRGLEYTQEILPSFKKVAGDSFYYISVLPFGTSIRKSSRVKKVSKDISELQTSETEIDKNVLCFDEIDQAHIKNINWDKVIEKSIDAKVEKIFEAMKWEIEKEAKVKKIKDKSIFDKKMEDPKFKTVYDKVSAEVDKCLVSVNVLPKGDITKNETFNISHSFKTKAEITERTIMVAEAFGLGIDEEKSFTLYDNVELKIKSGDIVYITGDSGSGKSWMLNNIFAKLDNSIAISDLKVDENEVIVEGVGKNLNDALMKLNIAGLGDAFLYLRKYSQLSDGQKYRYRIAKFIDQDKNIWILDEFCATLDRVTAKVVAYNLQKIDRKLNKTIVVATTHTDLLEEIRPTVHIVKGYESDIVISYYNHSDWKDKELEFYKDIKVEFGIKEDYEKLKKFHYRQASLGALKKVYKCTYKDEVIGVIVICYPHLALKGRNVALNNELSKMTKENCERLNKEFDSIARVIIHPKYRGIGLAQFMLKEYFKLTDAVYTETLAVMANYTPFFERAGMKRIETEDDVARIIKVKQLEQYEFNISLLSSKRYCESIFNKLSTEQQAEVKEIIRSILSKYKGQISKLFSHKESVDDLIAKDVCVLMKELQRADTVYLIKKLKE